MALKAHLENQAPTPIGEERRGYERRALFLEVSGGLPGGLEENVIVHNLSNGGLLLETQAPLASGEKFVLDLPEAGPIRTTVVWESGSLFGCAFEQLLDDRAMAAIALQADPAALHVGPSLKTPTEPLGVKLNRLRRERGLTLAQVASVLGVSKPTVWAWEKGKARPLHDRLDAIAQVLGVEAKELEERIGDEQYSGLVQECRLRIATAYGVHSSKIRIMIEV